MMVKFPSLDTLQLALTTGAIPPSVARARAVAGFGEADQVWVEPSVALPRSSHGPLRTLGAEVCKNSGAELSIEVSSWLELLPLHTSSAALPDLGQVPVLFELSSGEPLARLVVEMLRLGNDRQSFRALETGQPGTGPGRALLRVIGPPYYSLLRALDHPEDRDAPHAFVEQAPGVWVEMGYVHPLADRILPPKGQILLLRPPRRWTVVPDAAFHDVYEVLQLELPEAPSAYRDTELAQAIRVPLSLRPGGSPDGAELWVVRDDAMAVLNHFVQHADDRILEQLRFAVGKKGDQTLVVLRVRKQQQPPPVLVLPAQAYKPYLKLPNLFLPAGMILYPPLRRDVVRRLLAEDLDRLVWLQPGPDDGFTPESLPEDSFRPLREWVEYVLDRDHETLQAWMQASRFDFEQLVCTEEQEPRPSKPPGPEKPRNTRSGRGGDPVDTPSSVEDTAPEAEEVVEEAIPLDDFATVDSIEPGEAVIRLRQLEEEFLNLEGALDRPERQAMWPELAALHGQLDNYEDAGLCWLHALWEKAPPAWVGTWLRTEGQGLSERHESTHHGPSPWVASLPVSLQDLDRLLRRDEPTASDLRALSAYILWAAQQASDREPLLQRLAQVQRFLETHEKLLPIRAVWLAWYHLAQLAHGDTLALARTRDRLLERLYYTGLRPEQDLPSFLRFAGQSGSQRFRAVHTWMVELAERAQEWVEKNVDTSAMAPTQKPPMDAYVNLLFSFGLARLGEIDASRTLLEQARATLTGRDDVHTFLLQGYEYRIRQVLEGSPPGGPLPTEMMGQVGHMLSMHEYVVDKLRKHSHILEPDQRINPYRKSVASVDELERALSQLDKMHDRQEIAARLHKLLRDTPRGSSGDDDRLRILLAALEVAPRVNEAFAREMLDTTLLVYDAQPDLSSLAENEQLFALDQRPRLLEQAMSVAAHFDRVEHIHPLMVRFEKLLQTPRGPQAIKTLDTLAAQCFRGLRKLGLRTEIEHLLELMATSVLAGRRLENLEPQGLRVLLHVAAGWYYFCRDSQADPILQRAREVLLKGQLEPREQTLLACAYARTVGQAAVTVAQKRLEELFQHLRNVQDNSSSSKYFSIAQLDLIESVVLAVVSDDFTMGTQGRRWLDDDELIVRRRIHRDWRALEALA